MAGRKKGGNTVEQVRALAEPIAKQLGYSLWDIRFLKEGAEWYLRIFIDKPEGIGIDDCVAMSRAVNGPLDELDPIEQSYCLEVCSPGVNRELTRDEHFEAFLGWPVEVRLIRPLPDGRREIMGILEEYTGGSNGELLICEEQEQEEERQEAIRIPKAAVSRVRLCDEEISGGMEEK